MHADKIQTVFAEAMAEFNRSPAIAFVQSDGFTSKHYGSILREIFHYAREDPQIQALASVFFRGSDRHMVRMFLRHASSEIGHDLMALADLEALGQDVSTIPHENPLPATTALTAFPFFQVHYRNPVGYLGYLYFLEHMPTQHGATYAAALTRARVPEAAMGFLKEHMTVDVAHNKLMEKYLEQLVHDDKDADAICYAIHVTAKLYADMMWAAIRRVEEPRHFGWAWEESARTRGSFTRAAPQAAAEPALATGD